MPEKQRQYSLEYDGVVATLTVNEKAVGLGRCALTYQGDTYYCKDEGEAMMTFVCLTGAYDIPKDAY